jgi:3-methylcrotonyl-CoA carboxylase alpha subunit
MGAAAVVIGEAIRYCNAGTVEFILDQQTRQFYFLEVNTRLQVEHPITEAITGLDLVEVQLRVAEGWSLPELGLVSGKVPRSGHAIECRLYCEDPNNNFMPSVGLLEWFKPPTDIAVRFCLRLKIPIGDTDVISIYHQYRVADSIPVFSLAPKLRCSTIQW